MSKSINNIIARYTALNDIQLDEAEGLPPLPDAPAGDPAAAGPPPIDPMGGMSPMPQPEPEVKTMSDEAWVSSVKTMIELLSYGLNADEDVAHRAPVSKWLKMKDEIDKENAFDIAEEIDEFLANED
tara:strand:- start:1448 stop:1828 length:381 start_codon:yes stop_codon:yes gene_type:complete